MVLPLGSVNDFELSFDPVRDIEEFHKKFGLTYDGKPRALPGDLLGFRRRFMTEELEEYNDSAALALDTAQRIRREASATPTLLDELHKSLADDLELSLDALVDLVYVALGTAYFHGFNFKEAWTRVHAANMKKERVAKADDSKRNSIYDVVKPPGWKPPSHRDLVEDNAHK